VFTPSVRRRSGEPAGVAVVLSDAPGGLPAPVARWIAARGFAVERPATANALMALALRGRPAVAVIDARARGVEALPACERLKRDSYSGVVPAVVLCDDEPASLEAAFVAGADEVFREGMPDWEITRRLDTLLRRSERDTGVHPSTRLPGTTEIEASIARHIAAAAPFATCYADLDHFKEFNDRYSYVDGDRVIRILAGILHDVVKGLCGEDGFVGHIGGDDFIFIVPAPRVHEVCGEIVAVFDALVPYQYSDADQRAGYYFGKDRRGQLHRVPLMTLSIGVVTNDRRRFTHAGQVSGLATEMKSYAKTLPGSKYSIDRRQEVAPGATAPTGAVPGAMTSSSSKPVAIRSGDPA
jgi:diguanylate cyclase (GGDEF)-like protein